MSHLQQLPQEIALYMVSFMGSARAILRFSGCSKYYYQLMRDVSIWDCLCQGIQLRPYESLSCMDSYRWFTVEVGHNAEQVDVSLFSQDVSREKFRDIICEVLRLTGPMLTRSKIDQTLSLAQFSFMALQDRFFMSAVVFTSYKKAELNCLRQIKQCPFIKRDGQQCKRTPSGKLTHQRPFCDQHQLPCPFVLVSPIFVWNR